MSKAKFPIVVKRGHTVVKIYRTPSQGCESFTVVHYLGKKRVRKTFSDLDLAITEAETVANKLSAGELDVLTLSSQERLSYVRAVAALAPTNIPLEMAAIEFAEAVKLLKGGSVLEAVRDYAKRHPSNRPQRTVSQVVNELLAAKRSDGVSAVYLKDLDGRLGRFARSFKTTISTVSVSDIEDFLRSLELSGR